MEKCACIIVNYNDSETTEKLLKQISGFSALGLILVVDNCSTDDSYFKLKKFENDIIQVIKSEKNGGYGYGNNYGMKYCKNLGYKYAILSNPDVFFSEQLVFDMFQYVDDDVAIIAPKQRNINGDEIKNVAWRIPSLIEACFFPFVSNNILYSHEYLNSSDCVDVQCVPGAFFLFDIDKIIEVGGYDERIFMYCEESLIGIKLKNSGYKTLLLKDKYYIHKHPLDKKKYIKNEVKLHRIWNKNRLFIIKNYLNASRGMFWLAKIVYNVDLLRVILKNTIKKMMLRIGLRI